MSLRLALPILLILSPYATPARASDWSATNLWLLHGSQFEVGAAERTILRVEHADGWSFGDNYLFFDTIDSGAQSTAMYGEYAPRLSIGKLLGKDLAAGPIADVLVAGAINMGNDFRAYLYGAAVDLKLPGFAYFQLNAYVRDDKALAGQTWQLTPVWLYPFQVGSLKFSLQGFIDYAGTEGPSRTNLVAAPRLWLDVGALFGTPQRIEAGVEYMYWRNKYGIDGVTERVLQPSVKWTF